MLNKSKNWITSLSTIRPASHWGGVVVLLLVMVGIRLHQLDTVALRGDEAFTVLYWTTPPFSEGYFDLLAVEPHPIGTLTLYWLWTEAAGTSEFAVRMLPLFFNVLGGAMMMALTHRLSKQWRLVFMVGVVWAVHPFLVWHAQDARNYAMITFTAPLAMYWLWRAIQHPQSERTLVAWWPYILAQTFGLYIYLFEAFIVVVGLLAMMIWAWRRPLLLWRAFQAWLIIGLLSLPIVVQLYHLVFVSEYQGTATSSSIPPLFEEFIPTLWLGDTTAALGGGVVFAVVGGLILVLARQRWGLLVGLWAFGPLVMLYFAGHFSSIFRPRYVIHVVPAFLLIGIVGLDAALHRLKVQKARPVLVTVVVLGLVGIYWGELYAYFYTEPAKAPDWRGLTDYLDGRATEQDTVVSGLIDPALEYYYDKPITFIPYEETDPSAIYAGLLTRYDAIYVLADARTASAGAFFQANAQVIYGDDYPGVSQARPWIVNPREIANKLAVQFGDVAILRGYTVLDGPHGGTILLLYWEPLRQTERDFSVLLHLSREVEGPLVAALDHGVANSIVSTTTWQPGVLVRDWIVLPSDPGGDVVVRVGWYPTGDASVLVPIGNMALEDQFAGRYVLPTRVSLRQP